MTGPATERPSRGFIDVNAWFGPDHGMAATAGAPLADLVATRRSAGIRTSLAGSLVAAWSHGATGDDAAIEAAAEPANGLAAISVIAAHRAADAAQRVARAEAGGVVGYRLHGWPTATGANAGPASIPGSVREIAAAVARTGRPLLVEVHGPADAEAIGAATADLGIPVILLGAHYTHIVDDLAAAVRYPHLHLDTSSLAHFRAIESVVAAVGHERVLLGTGSPRRPAASPIEAVLAAAIDDDTKRAILAGNAARLFGLAAASVDLAPTRVPARAFDVHAHLGPMDFAVPDVPPPVLLETLRVPPTSAAVASSGVAIFGDPLRGNADAARVVADAHGAGLYGYVVADPADRDFTEDQLRRHLDAPGMLGVKVHAEWSGIPTASRAMFDLFELLARFGRPVKIHNAGDGWADALGVIATRHPGLPIIIAHGGPGTPSLEGARLAASHDRIYVELASSFADRRAVREVVAATPPERLLWGSDTPLLEPAFVLGTYLEPGLPDAALDRIFWDNAVDLFGVEPGH